MWQPAVLKATNEFILVNTEKTKIVAGKKRILCRRRFRDAYFCPSPEEKVWFLQSHFEIIE